MVPRVPRVARRWSDVSVSAVDEAISSRTTQQPGRRGHVSDEGPPNAEALPRIGDEQLRLRGVVDRDTSAVDRRQAGERDDPRPASAGSATGRGPGRPGSRARSARPPSRSVTALPHPGCAATASDSGTSCAPTCPSPPAGRRTWLAVRRRPGRTSRAASVDATVTTATGAPGRGSATGRHERFAFDPDPFDPVATVRHGRGAQGRGALGRGALSWLNVRGRRCRRHFAQITST